MQTEFRAINSTFTITPMRRPFSTGSLELSMARERFGMPPVLFGDLMTMNGPATAEIDTGIDVFTLMQRKWESERPMVDILSNQQRMTKESFALGCFHEIGLFMGWAVDEAKELVEATQTKEKFGMAVFPDGVVVNLDEVPGRAIKEVLDSLVFPVKTGELVRGIIAVNNTDETRVVDFPEKTINLVQSLFKAPAEDAILKLTKHAYKNVLSIVDAENLSRWARTDLRLIQVTLARYLGWQGVDAIGAYKKVLDQNAYNYPANVFSEDMKQLFTSLGLDPINGGRQLQRVVKKMRYESYLGSGDVSFLDLFNLQTNKQTPAVAVLEWMKQSLPGEFLEEVGSYIDSSPIAVKL